MNSKSCFLIENPLDLYYLTGLKLTAGMLFVAPKKSCLFVDGRYIEVAQNSCPLPVQLTSEEAQRKFLKSQGIQALIFDSARTSCERRSLLKRLLGLRMIARPHLLRKARSIKNASEIAKLKESAKLNYAGYQHIAAQLKTGISERELALAFQVFCLKEGAEGVSFEPIIAFGKNSALPHHRAGPTRLQKGDIVLFDLGVQLDSYASDMTRIQFFGKADPAIKKLYHVVRAAQRAALDLCKPGTELGLLDKAARAVMAKHEVEELFLHSLGHGIGLELHEFPSIRQKGVDSETPLKSGMAITIEPGLYLQGKGGVRYEDTILITDTGYLNLYPEEVE